MSTLKPLSLLGRAIAEHNNSAAPSHRWLWQQAAAGVLPMRYERRQWLWAEEDLDTIIVILRALARKPKPGRKQIDLHADAVLAPALPIA